MLPRDRFAKSHRNRAELSVIVIKFEFYRGFKIMQIDILRRKRRRTVGQAAAPSACAFIRFPAHPGVLPEGRIGFIINPAIICALLFVAIYLIVHICVKIRKLIGRGKIPYARILANSVFMYRNIAPALCACFYHGYIVRRYIKACAVGLGGYFFQFLSVHRNGCGIGTVC